jgi:hypothetical protein
VRVQITLKSGAQVVVDVDRMDVGYDGPGDRIASLRWRHDRGGGDLLGGVVRSEIAAVVLLAAPAPVPPDIEIELREGP